MKAKIVCETKLCPREGKVINMVTFPKDQEDTFYESFGHGGEERADFCKSCGKLGVLKDPEHQFTIRVWVKAEPGGLEPVLNSREDADKEREHWQLLHPENRYEVEEI